jgi:GNAT superfamily N-acetyltransferase
MKQVEIVEFTEKYAADFARLNYEWIEHFFQIEAHDREMLDNPVEYIIKDGGQIFFALSGEKAVGTVALLRVGEDSFELAKMAVTPEYRGLKIGEKLISVCLDYAKRVGKKRVFLLSNTKLTPALTLYKKFGFREIPLDPDNLYERTDIQMEILL